MSIGGRPADPYDEIIERLRTVLEQIKKTDGGSRARGEGSRILAAMPVVGIGYGGYTSQRGMVVTQLIDAMSRAAVDLNMDIALVTPDPSVYAAAQYARRGHESGLPAPLEQKCAELGKRACRGELALLIGAGVSVAAGLPSWHQLLAELRKDATVDHLVSDKFPLSVTDEAELLLLSNTKQDFHDRIATITELQDRPSLLHALLAGVDSRQVVTTNYDQLFEKAVRATGRKISGVMPWQSANGAERWILKLHGDVKHPKSIVLTRHEMVRYDASRRPAGSILQALLLTKHLLVVGTSMTDDNVLRLAHEVSAYRQEHGVPAERTYGTVLDAGGDIARQRLWQGQLDWVALPDPALGLTGPRAIELVLDRIALHASRDSSWLLDPRFAVLLDENDEAIAAKVRGLYGEVAGRSGATWAPLVERLEELGAKPEGSARH